MKKAYHVIVVGLGPGGSTTARALAAMGYRVLALEKSKMPKTKTCGGCLSARVAALLDSHFTDVVDQTVEEVELTFKGEQPLTFKSDAPIAHMVMRKRFDSFLADKAQAVGVEIHDSEKVTAIEEYANMFIVSTTKSQYSTRYIVGADGVNGVTGKLLGLSAPRRLAVALESETIIDKSVFSSPGNTMHIDLGEVPSGYGWLFPKRGHWSAGVGTVGQFREHPKTHYDTLKRNKHFDEHVISEQRNGFRIPLFNGRSDNLVKPGALLVGDAAALVDPLLGEGIYYAIASGQIAAHVINKAAENGSRDMTSYYDLLDRHIYPELEAARQISKYFYRFNKLSYALFVAKPEVANLIMRVLRGDLSYVKLWQEIRSRTMYDLIAWMRLFSSKRKMAQISFDSVANNYDGLRFYWQESFAQEATLYYNSLVREYIRDGATVLDAGTGTGENIRSLLRLSRPRRIVGLDSSRNMLEVARNKIDEPGVEFQQGDMLMLPFSDRSFDAVLATWSIETCSDPKRAVQEFLRVINDDGYVICLFATMPQDINRLYAYFLEASFGRGFNWRFLNHKLRPFHECNHSSITQFAAGLITAIVLRKCCSVSQEFIKDKLPRNWHCEQAASIDGPTVASK